MLNKTANYTLIDIQPLNNPILDEYIVRQNLKIAQNIVDVQNSINASRHLADMTRDSDNSTFDLQAEIEKHPNSLYVKCFAIKADEENDNADYFSKTELKKAVGSFVGCPVFTNHKNDDINEARGKIIHSWWNEERNGIMVIARVDAAAYPQLARGIREEYIVGTSMGCQVHHSTCSICHNYAETPDQYCIHIRERKTRIVSQRRVKCQFHEHGPKDQPCPLCDSTKDDRKTFDVIEKKAFEHNYGIKFIENSFVVNPACHDCGVTEVIDPAKFTRKVADILGTIKVAGTDKVLQVMRMLKEAGKEIGSGQGAVICDDKQCYRVAGQKQLQDLQNAINLLVSVSQDMLKQKDQIDLEFLSDLVAVLSDLQTVTDELNQQGYGRLPDPGQAANTEAAQPGATAPTPTIPVNPTPGGGSKVQTGPAGGAGTVTGPTATQTVINLEKLSEVINERKHLNMSAAIFDPKIKLELDSIIKQFKRLL